MCRASLFITDKNWTQSQYPSTCKCIKIVHPNTGILLSNKKGQTIDAHNDMDESQVLTQRSQAQKAIYWTIPL